MVTVVLGRTTLLLHPLTVIRDARPAWVALEQVPGALPAWLAYAAVLQGWGYSVAVSKVRAEQYGTPQVRKRAVLMAHREREVSLPAPTHSRYHRHAPSRLDPGVLPWVTMNEGLGRAAVAAVPGDISWTAQRPSPAMVGSYRPDVVAAPGYRKAGDPPRQKTPGSVLLAGPWESGILQGFDADFPWQGSTASRYLQSGNAIPVGLAAAVLSVLIEEA